MLLRGYDSAVQACVGTSMPLDVAASCCNNLTPPRVARTLVRMDAAGSTNAELLRRAAAGDDLAWRHIVDTHAGLVWSVIRSYGIGPEAHEDVFQTVWLRLAEGLDKIRNPERLAAWLAQVSRNEAVGVYRKRQRVVPHEGLGVDAAQDLPDPDAALNLEQTQLDMRRGLERIGTNCQRLLTALVATPRLSYEEIGELLGIAVGSIGPTRARCLESLRQTPEVRQMIEERGM